MTATDELRRLLDERGVKHYDGTETTLWGYEPTGELTGAYRFAADEIADGFFHVSMMQATAEQAVVATLGREPEEASMIKLHEQMDLELLGYRLAIGLDTETKEFDAEMHHLLEEAATLGPGTCEVVSSTLHEYEGGYAGSEWEHELSCGHTVWWGSGDTPEWCPWCGRRVVE